MRRTHATPVSAALLALMVTGVAAVAACPAPRGAPTPRTGEPVTASATAGPLPPVSTDSLARARALLLPYDPGGASRDAVEMLLRLAGRGRADAFAMLARAYVDWTAYAAYAADAPLLTLIERDLGVEGGPHTTPFPLPSKYVDRLAALARKGKSPDLVDLIATWKLHDLGPEYWRGLARRVADPAAALWALMDCEAAAGAARGVPEGYAPWVMARGCAVLAPETLPRLVESGPEDRRRLLREAIGCDPAADAVAPAAVAPAVVASGGTRCADADVDAALHGPLRDFATPETIAAYLALLGRARLAARLERGRIAGEPLPAFAAAALAGATTRRIELPLTASFVGLPRKVGPPVPELPRTTFGLWTDETRVVLALMPSGTSLASKPLLAMTGATPAIDFGPATGPYPGEPVTPTRLAEAISAHFLAWEKRGLGGSTTSSARPAGRAVALAIDGATPMRVVTRALVAAQGASVEAFVVLARRHDGSITEAPLRVSVPAPRPAKKPASPMPFVVPAPAALELRVEETRVRLVPKGLPGLAPVAIPHRAHRPDLPALYAAAQKMLRVAEEHAALLRATAGKGVPFADLFDALDALRYEVPGGAGAFADRAAFDAARFAAAAHASPDAPRRVLGGAFTVVLEP